MNRPPSDLLPPRILVVDDERQIHASLRLRLGAGNDLTFCSNAREALALIPSREFDLCFADIHMPHMDGLTFIAAAAKIDRHLGFVVLSAFDSDENLRRAIPLQVYEFIGKPLPERAGFEDKIPDWVQRTRQRRHDQDLASKAGAIHEDLDSARLEREVECVASESARDALLQTASLLSTIHAHLVAATAALSTRVRTDAPSGHLLRGLEEARKTADAAISVTEGFFGSGYGSRDSSAALLGSGVRHAVNIANRMTRAESRGQTVDCGTLDDRIPVRGLTGIDFLLMMVPAIAAALAVAPENSTVRITADQLGRLDAAVRDPALRSLLWLNRRNALASQPGIMITLAAAAPALSRPDAEAWLRGEKTPLASVTTRGLQAGIQKCQGLLGLAVSPSSAQFRIALALPT